MVSVADKKHIDGKKMFKKTNRQKTVKYIECSKNGQHLLNTNENKLRRYTMTKTTSQILKFDSTKKMWLVWVEKKLKITKSWPVILSWHKGT